MIHENIFIMYSFFLTLETDLKSYSQHKQYVYISDLKNNNIIKHIPNINLFFYYVQKFTWNSINNTDDKTSDDYLNIDLSMYKYFYIFFIKKN
jgi:hypothetical protein